MSAIKLSMYFYRVFAVVFASCKLYLVAQEVDFKVSWPFPIHTLRNCQRTSQRKRNRSLCMSRYNLVTEI